MKPAGRSSVRPANPREISPMPRTHMARKTVDLTTTHAEVLDKMIALAEERASTAGLPVTVGSREFLSRTTHGYEVSFKCLQPSHGSRKRTTYWQELMACSGNRADCFLLLVCFVQV